MWTHEEVEYLKNAYESGEPVRSIAYALKKSTSAVKNKASRLDTHMRTHEPWPKGAIKLAVDMINAGKTYLQTINVLMGEYELSHRKAADIYNFSKRNFFTNRTA